MTDDTPNQTPPGQKKTGQEINRADLHAAPVHAELVEAILSQLEVFFSSKMAQLFVNADEYLFQSADHAKNTAEQNRLFEFMNALRKQREMVGKNFFAELNKFLKPVAISRELPKKKHHTAAGQTGLSLIDQDEMDEMVTLTTISGKATVEYREELAHLEARLEHLALQNRNIFHPKALDPQHICEAFQEALTISDFDKDNKIILYKLFDSELLKHIKNLYDDLNGLMIRAGILPQIEHTGKIRRDPRDNRQRTAHQPPAVDELLTPAQTQGPLGRGGQSGGYYTAPATGGGGYAAGGYGYPAGQAAGGMAGSGAAGYATAGAAAGGGASGGGVPGGGVPGGGMAVGGGSGGAAGGLASGQGGTGGGQPGGSGRPGGQAATATGHDDQRLSAGLPAGHIRQSISGFLGGDPATADGGGSGSIDTAVYYTRQEVVSALSGMQNVVEVSPQATLQFDAGAIKKAVLASIGERSGGIVSKRVNQISEKTIDFIKLIFDAIIEDRGINDTIKALLLSLQIPIIKAAMLDAEFFVDDQHPARQLLDRIAEAGVGVSDHKDVVYIELNAIVKTLLKDYNEDISAFSVALEAIKALTDRIYEQARNTERQSQEQVKHTHARNVVLQEIRKITLGKELAPGIRVLVLKIWPSLMFNHYLRAGKANDEWVEMLMILSKVIESVQPHHSMAELEDLGLSYEDIIQSVSEKLKKNRKSGTVIEQAINDLRDTYSKLDVQRAAAEKTGKEEAVAMTASSAAEVAPPVEEPVAGTAAAPVEQEEQEATTVPAAEAMAETVGEAPDETGAGEAEAVISPEAAARSKLAKLPADVQPGAWFIVYNGENRPVRRLKLAVILMQDATMVFVDHLGNVVVEKDAEVFAGELERGASGIIMQHSVFDHALRSALTSIQR
ncbi:MAG: hypothetical protein QG652_868 [Pseudomonadota bacterium]|nr:hypothetical protein [Pseudomonadota bacterium]